jgi:phosphoribosylglycinamide formyltransferase 1
MVKPIRLGVLASGTGTDLQSIIDACEQKKIDATVVVVISDNESAYALERARNHNIDDIFIDPKGKNKSELDTCISKELELHNVDLVVGAGYMRILSDDFVKKWFGKLINIHPALLPSFKGVNGQGDALQYGVKITGCTTHFIDNEMDHGPIILQAAVLVKNDDSRDTLTKRILEVEHQILPRTVQLFAEKRLTIKGRTVFITKKDTWKDSEPVFPDVLYSEGY